MYNLKGDFGYSGEVSKLKAHGKGKVLIPNIGFLEGEFLNGTLKSSWSLGIDQNNLRVDVGPHFPRWPDTILIYNDQPEPKSSKKYLNAEINCNEGGTTGKANINFPNDNSYTGFIKDWMFEGSGKYYWGKDLFYEGGWKNGLFNGFGKIVKENTLVYEGDFYNGKFHGIGKCLLNNKWVYDGEWENGHFYGTGILSAPDEKFLIVSHDENGKLLSSLNVNFKID